MEKDITNNKQNVLVTIAIGKKYIDFYNRNFRKSHEAFSKKINVPLIVIYDYIDDSLFGKNRHPAWQKLKIFDSSLTEGYERICWIDADIFITSHAKNPFDLIPKGSWGAVRNNIYNLKKYKKNDPNLYSFCPSKNRPKYILNTGFFVVERKLHSNLFNFIYHNYHEQTCYENGPLSYHLLNTHPGCELKKEFNLLMPLYGEKFDINLKTLFVLVRDSYFIHFAGGINKKHLKIVAIMDYIIKVKFFFKRIMFKN